MTNATDKVRAALERACIWDVEGAEYYREAIHELDGMALVPVEPTDTQIHAGMEALKLCPSPDAYIEYKNSDDETVYFSGAPSRQYRAMIAPYVSPEKQAVKGE